MILQMDSLSVIIPCEEKALVFGTAKTIKMMLWKHTNEKRNNAFLKSVKSYLDANNKELGLTISCLSFRICKIIIRMFQEIKIALKIVFSFFMFYIVKFIT